MKKLSCVFCLLVLGWILPLASTWGQDMNYTQYFSTPLYVNPAFTGINTGVRARFLFRDQWPSAPIAYKSYYFSADLGDRALPGAGGLGLVVEVLSDFLHPVVIIKMLITEHMAKVSDLPLILLYLVVIIFVLTVFEYRFK